MVAATKLSTIMKNKMTTTKKKNLPMREPVELAFKPNVSQRDIDAAVDKAISKYQKNN